MRLLHRFSAAALAALTLSVVDPAFAQVATDPVGSLALSRGLAPDSLPPALKNAAKANGLKVLKSFPAAGGLTGWLVEPPRSKPTLVFTTLDGQVLVTGMLLSAEGRQLNNEYSDKHIPRPDYQSLGAQLEKLKVVVDGARGAAAKSTIYVFADPMCVYCNLLYRAVDGYKKAGLQVKWILLGFLTPDSEGKAAAIYESNDPVAALQRHEMTMDAMKETGGIDPIEVKGDTAAALHENADLWRRFGLAGTPSIVYKVDGKYAVKMGFPGMAELAKMLNLPEQPQSDPLLLEVLRRHR